MHIKTSFIQIIGLYSLTIQNVIIDGTEDINFLNLKIKNITDENGNDMEAREKMMYASVMAAMAFSNAQLYEACQNRADQYLGIITLGRALYETGDVKGIYALVTDTINEILPNISNIFISNYEPLQGRITCVYGYQDNKSMDVDVFRSIQN